LISIAKSSGDKECRDQLFDHYIDRRSDREIINEPYIPNQIKAILRLALNAGEISREHLKVFDLYLRVVDRLGSLPQNKDQIVKTLWYRPHNKQYQYKNLCRMAQAIELIQPGHIDANYLRAAARLINSKMKPSKPQTPPTTMSEIDHLVDAARQTKKGSIGRPYSKETQITQRRNLLRYKSILSDAGLPFALDRKSMDLFADFAVEQFELTLNGDDKGWSATYIATMFQNLAIFVSDVDLRSDILHEAATFTDLAKTRLKKKERVLIERPTDLPKLFEQASGLLKRSRLSPYRNRHRIINVAAGLALLCCYPLRRSDLIRLRFGVELQRELSGWLLVSLPTQKTGVSTDPLRLPPIVTEFIDAALLRGANKEYIWDIYQQKKGSWFIIDWRTGERHTKAGLTALFTELVRYSPHILRTIWTDHLKAIGADRTLISAMLQHSNLISQHEYEVLSKRLLLNQGVKALANVARQAEDIDVAANHIQ
jgi:hypothetical protein